MSDEYSNIYGFLILIIFLVATIILNALFNKLKELLTFKKEHRIDVSHQVIMCPNCSTPLADLSNTADWKFLNSGVRYFSGNCPKCRIGVTVDTKLGENQRVSLTGKN